MKILQINKFLYPQGGAETYFLELSELLKQDGQEVVYFSQRSPQNFTHHNEEYFVSPIDLQKFSLRSLFIIGRIFWSFEASRKITQLIKKEKPDIVHIHNIYHQISPSILRAIKKFKLPIVMTVHDYKLIRPDYSLRADGKTILPKDSLAVQLLLTAEFLFHKMIGVYKKNVDLFLAPSPFIKSKLIEAGYDEKKIVVTPLFIDLNAYTPGQADTANPYILFFGRLHESKGADILLKAFSMLSLHHPMENLKLKIAGTGPDESKLKKLARELSIESRVEFVGQKSKIDMIPLIQKSLFTISQSRLHETFGLSAIESLACGKPVVASAVGALPDLINDKNGLLFEVDNFIQLKNKIDYLLDNPEVLAQMSQEAVKTASNFPPHRHTEQIIDLYYKLILQAQNGKS